MTIKDITTKTTIDTVTGEIVQTEQESTKRVPKTADFVMAFTKDLQILKNLTHAEMMTLFGMLQEVNSKNEVIMNKSIKSRICKKYDLKLSSMDVFISNLKKKQIIIQVERGIYLLQPNLFGKGKWSDIKKLRMNIEWDFENQTKKMSSEAEYLTESEILMLQQAELQKKIEEVKRKEKQKQQLEENKQNES